MKRTFSGALFGIVLALLLVGMLAVAFKYQSMKAPILGQAQATVPSRYPVHNLNDGLNYTTIQAAINANQTQNGNTIFVQTGTYYEHVTITKSISLLGEDKDVTTVDGNGTGTAIQIEASNVSIIDFTIRNAGKIWYGKGTPDSCVSGNNVTRVHIENDTLTDAAVCAWFSASSLVNVSRNVVSNATTIGAAGFASTNITMSRNVVCNCGGIGLHLDGNSVNCKITNNTVKDCLEGIEVERSAGNLVGGNQLTNDNASIWVDKCSGLNVFRDNNMTSDEYNLIVWGWSLESFVQDIDTSNIVNNKIVYYITNSHDLLVNSSNCPNMGYLAIVNCTNITTSGVNLSFNRDGLLMAKSTNCSLVNITLSGNIGPLLWGGLTFFESKSNLIVDNRISNNSVGICFYDSNENTLCHNSFVNNKRQVISNFYSPSLLPSGSNSRNIWDDGYPSGGNYWSDYTGVDVKNGLYQNQTGSDGIGDTFHVVDANNTDKYPLMGTFYTFKVWAPPKGVVNVISNSSVSNLNLSIWLSSPVDGLQPGQWFIDFLVTGENSTIGFCRIAIPKQVLNGTSYVVLVNWQPVDATLLSFSNNTVDYVYFTYNLTKEEVVVTIPEYLSFPILPSTVIATLLAVTIYRRRRLQT